MPRVQERKTQTLPTTFKEFTRRFPQLAESHEAIARQVDQLGPLDRKSCELIKLGISIGAGLTTATQSHAKRARQEGASLEEIEQAILLTFNTCGFPRTVAAWKWAKDALKV